MVEVDFDEAVEALARVFKCDPAIRHERAIRKYLAKFRLAAKRDQTRLGRLAQARNRTHKHLISGNDVLDLAQIPTGNLANQPPDHLRICVKETPAQRTEEVECLGAAFARIDR